MCLQVDVFHILFLILHPFVFKSFLYVLIIFSVNSYADNISFEFFSMLL